MSAQRTDIPAKLFFRIGEVSTIVGVEPHVLRYWEGEFQSIRPQKSRKGQRVYSRKDVEKLLRVKELLYAEGFTIAGARKRLRETGVEPREVSDPAILRPQRLRTELLSIRGEVLQLLTELGVGVDVFDAPGETSRSPWTKER